MQLSPYEVKISDGSMQDFCQQREGLNRKAAISPMHLDPDVLVQ